MGRTFSWAVNILLGFTLLFLGSADFAVAAEKIKITLPGVSTTFAPLYHAQSAGYFAEEGLEVEVVVVLGAGSVQAVLSRDAQFAIAPGPYQLLAYEKGQPLMAVMSILTRNAINIVMHKDAAKQKGITERSSLADKIKALKGLRISGGTPGGFIHQIVISYLRKAGLDPEKDVQIVGVGDLQGLMVSLEQRHIDVFGAGTPIPEAVVARGFGVMVVDNSIGEDPDFAEFMMDVVLVSPETVKQRPELIRKVVRALLKANAWLLDHPSEQAVSVMKPVLNRVENSVILAGLQKTRLGIPRDGRITERAVTLTQEFLRRVGTLKAPIPYDQIVTNEFLPR
jgi:NitT/TauT family transport system substrate-binding protein